MVKNIDGGMKASSNIYYEVFQAESMRDAAFGCDWVGTAIPFQRCVMFIIATANEGFHLSAGKFVPVSNVTTLNVCICMYVCMYVQHVWLFVRMYACMYVCIYVAINKVIRFKIIIHG
jgi:hypothetical protein